ncbi:ABC transporter C family member 13 [Eumeta japonica]|uniref:ABC-type xenobiotic transporter n=1 Tax=Eumeta variegata TaxID=151549 RepID=A0A4C1W263_EUMVA|nr:ABC transporter C family member 13 [Eumeta japonica]
MDYQRDSPWKWEYICGPGGLEPWDELNKDVGLCFQRLFLDVPVWLALAATSAYYVGYRSGWVLRERWQERAIVLRVLSALALAGVSAAQLFVAVTPAACLSAAAASLAWAVHSIYVLALRRRLGANSRGPIAPLICWGVAAVLTALATRSRALVQLSLDLNIPILVLHIVYLITLIPSTSSRVTFYSPCLVGSQHSHSEYTPLLPPVDDGVLGTAMQDCGFFSCLLFCWVNPLLQKGSSNELRDADELFDVPAAYRCVRVGARLHRALQAPRAAPPVQRTPATHPPFISTNRIVQPEVRKSRLYIRATLQPPAAYCGFAGPVLLGLLVTYVEDETVDVRLGYAYAAGLLAASGISALCTAHFNWQMAILGLQMRAALVSAILRKTLSVATAELSTSFTIGEITNFMSTDTDRIVNSCPSFHAFWSIPLQLFVTLFLMYRQVGVSFVAGVVFSVLLIPVNRAVAAKIGRLSTELMACKDARIALLADLLRGIRTIKLLCWEDYFVGRVAKERASELRYLRGRKYLDAICVVLWATTPVLVAVLTLGTHALRGAPLTASTVFTTVALINMLIAPLNAFPWVLNGLTEAWVSIKRIQRLLELSDMDPDHYYDKVDRNRDEDKVIILKKVTCTWPEPAKTHDEENEENVDETPRGVGTFVLQELNLEVCVGELVAVTGTVGAGKSSLLLALLGDMRKTAGEIQLQGGLCGFGYVPQKPWLVHGTVRENILFGQPYDEVRFKTVVEACALTEDLNSLGWSTTVGEGGCALSGGQRARVALARAVYHDMPVYLLDDVLSGLDARVAQHVLERCLLGLLRGRTRLLVTHSPQALSQADRVILMAGGQIVREGPPEVILDDLCKIMENEESLGEEPPRPLEPHTPDEQQCVSLPRGSDNLDEEEAMAEGSVSWGVIGMYLRAVGVLLVVAILLSVTLMQASQNATFLWLSYWVKHQSHNATDFTEDRSDHFYLAIYAGLAVANLILTVVRAFLFAYGGVRAAANVHEALLGTVVKGRMEFFDTTPAGRILNRFSSDTYTVDDSLPFIMNILLAQLFSLVGALAVVAYGLPWVCIVLLAVLPFCHWLQRRYRRTSRLLKRLQSITLSPLYSHFNETLEGATTIRALRATSYWMRTGEEGVEQWQRAALSAAAAAQWLTLRLQTLAVAIVGGAATCAALERHLHFADAGLVGLAISYALSTTSMLANVMNAFTETEREMIAVERVAEYVTGIEPEHAGGAPPPHGWPSHGIVRFQDVVLRYRGRENSAPALREVSFETRSGEKLAVVGRTGAGKSSLVQALLRLQPCTAGRVLVDGVDVTSIRLHAVRDRIAVIPQEPFIFTGSVYDNVDPLRLYSELEVWSALERAGVREAVESRGGLNTSAVGLSRGRMQLLCLARTLLRRAKVLVLDEATASVDHDTERAIMESIQTCCNSSTVLMVVHRVHLALEAARVLVMGGGRVLELDSPAVLLSNPASHLSRLARAHRPRAAQSSPEHSDDRGYSTTSTDA